jgi:hypothetical protein
MHFLDNAKEHSFDKMRNRKMYTYIKYNSNRYTMKYLRGELEIFSMNVD